MEAIELSEINFKNSQSDWIELKINSLLNEKISINDDKKITEILPEQISDEKYILIHFKANEDYTESIDGILNIYTKKSGITGTTEQITLKSDSKIIEGVCWQNSSPTSSEKKDINSLINEKIWEGQCIDSEKIKKNESIIKISENKNKESWKIFKHSTPGTENTITNSPPVAKITIQKPKEIVDTSKISLETPFSLNVDGSESFDPDGDEILYRWQFPNEIIDKKNPKSYRFDISGNYEVSLTVTDELGASDTETIQINALNRKEDIENKNLLDEVIKNNSNSQKITEDAKNKPSSAWLNYFLIILMAGVGLFICLWK